MTSNTALDLREPETSRAVDEPSRFAPAEMTPMQMAYQLIQSGADFQSVREMMALSKELAADQAKRAFDAAVAAAKSEIGPVIKNAKGHNSKAYANFAAYASAVDPVLSEHGLSYRFRTEQNDKITVTCVLSHKDGHSEENSISGPADTSGNKTAIQAIGSTLTYLQRYTLIQSLGLASAEDDDGQSHGKSAEELATVSEEQLETLRDLIAKTGSDIEKFCAYFKIDALPELRASRFEEAMQSLRKKAAK
ncbi:hypothetical protein GCM10011385_40110 [Nitratireductor aestuarii]|uniref:ERF superfamily protein n=1 Tax=Nitratireductor aestuarii TaxID=1735103 RepID=A0A916S3P8_9HYPH|nr:ERF family protein [Nitratireductor aestuarii]GGA81861.1 hypothetical protein GCM10011385_40110 [Nitratireductor aestuarii]